LSDIRFTLHKIALRFYETPVPLSAGRDQIDERLSFRLKEVLNLFFYLNSSRAASSGEFKFKYVLGAKDFYEFVDNKTVQA